MDYRALGRSGLQVSAVGLGCNNFGMTIDAAATKIVVDKAIDLGITLFDTADLYGDTNSEAFLGKALGTRRKDVLVATKFGIGYGKTPETRGGASRDYIIRAAEGSLKRLGTDYIDLYQLHRFDAATPLEETLRALEDLVRAGKVRYIGHSNLAGWQISEFAWAASTGGFVPCISAQNRYSVLSREIEAEVVPAAQAHGLGILPFFPLESGLLSGKYKNGQKPADDTRWGKWNATAPDYAKTFFSDERFAKVEKLEGLARQTGHGILDLAIGWLLSRPYVPSVIAGATRPEQVEQNVKAAAWRPSADVAKAIDEITAPKPM